MDETPGKSSTASTYRDRPWLRLYQPGKPADITPEHSDALSMWRSGLDRRARSAERPFLYYFGAPVTAATIEAESDALAAALAVRGLGRGDRLALYLQNVPQFVVGLLAAWKLGAIAVPVNPMLKERELHYVLSDCGARAIISLPDLWNSVASKAVDGTAVETMITTSPLDYLGGQEIPPVLEGLDRVATSGAVDLAELLREHAGARPGPVTLGPSDVALLTYTSGTTGDPKGARHPRQRHIQRHRLPRLDEPHARRCRARRCSAVPHHRPDWSRRGRDAGADAHGARLSIRPATINRLAERHRCTFTVMAITAFTAMTNDPAIKECDLSSLTKVYSGGAPIAPSIIERFEREAGPYIHNIYGLTETTSPSHAVPFGCRAPVDQASGASSVESRSSTRLSGSSTTTGTTCRPARSARSSPAAPWWCPGTGTGQRRRSNMPGGELRTGHVGFMDLDGRFYLVDRKKDMIVASGYKVWPREVEDRQAAAPGAARARPQPPGLGVNARGIADP